MKKLTYITKDEVQAIAIGAGILGTGGGGNTTNGRIWLEHELSQRHNACQLIDAGEIAEETLTCVVSAMGAPTVSIERLDAREQYLAPIAALERAMGERFGAIVCGEIGGANALVPIIVALQLGLPLVNGDGMARAFPELQMDNFSIVGVPSLPFALGDMHGNVAVFQTDSPTRAEKYSRALTVMMGSSAALIMPIMYGDALKKSLIRGTYDLAYALGEAVLEARRQSNDIPQAIAEAGRGQVLFRGKIVDVMRYTDGGFSRGRIELQGIVKQGDHFLIEFQNENLIAYHNGEVVCTVPDLISLVHMADGEPISTEVLRYGLRVAVLGFPAPRELKTPNALRVVGPSAFGYDVPFLPLDGNLL